MFVQSSYSIKITEHERNLICHIENLQSTLFETLNLYDILILSQIEPVKK